MSSKLSILSLLFILSLPACSWVKLTPEGEKVRVLSADEVAKCSFVGKTTSSTTDKVAGVKRHDNAINDELTVLARNAAMRLNGDTVVAEGVPSEGSQTFLVYRCVPQ